MGWDIKEGRKRRRNVGQERRQEDRKGKRYKQGNKNEMREKERREDDRR